MNDTPRAAQFNTPGWPLSLIHPGGRRAGNGTLNYVGSVGSLSNIKAWLGWLPFLFYFIVLVKKYSSCQGCDEKWHKSDEKTGFGGTLDLAPA